MREQLVKFLEENYGDLAKRFPLQYDLEVSECAFVNDEMTLHSVKIVGDSEC